MAMGDPGAPPPQAPATFEKVDKTFNLSGPAARTTRSWCLEKAGKIFEHPPRGSSPSSEKTKSSAAAELFSFTTIQWNN